MKVVNLNNIQNKQLLQAEFVINQFIIMKSNVNTFPGSKNSSISVNQSNKRTVFDKNWNCILKEKKINKYV